MSNLVPISELFTINYGNSLELINMEQCQSSDPLAVPFVSRTENNNGISAFVEREYDIDTNPAHTLSVAVGGSVLSTFQHVFSDNRKSFKYDKNVNNNLVKVKDLFDVVYGVNLELVNLIQCKSTDVNSIPFVSRTENNNGVSAFVERDIDIEPNPAHTLSVAGGGSVLSTFYQPLPYYSGRDIYILMPKQKMKIFEMLFYANYIKANKYKYNYGRQANKTLKDILLPVEIENEFIDSIKLKYINDVILTGRYIKKLLIRK
jgi:hypothetical protein